MPPEIRRSAAAMGALLGALVAGCTVTPDALTPYQLDTIATAAMSDVASGQEPILGPVSLEDAIARALRYNLDHQVELAERAVRERELDLAHFSLLPTLVANSGYAARDPVLASSSRNVFTGAESLATSTSQDRRLRSADATFAWNILDFGLSYVRARQAADKVLIQDELRRKVVLRLIEETRSAYWRAASAQRLMRELQRVEHLAQSVEREARRMAKDQVSSSIAALTYEREIVEIQRLIGELQRELNSAHAQLGALMNVPPGTAFLVTGTARRLDDLPTGSMEDLVRNALANRPELREVAYRRRINQHEAHAALLELLPGLNIYAAANFDSNSFLLHNHWESWGARASWNLLRVFSYPARRAVVDEQDDMLAKKTLAVAMAVMTQVYVSRIRLAHAKKEHRTAKRYRDVQRRLLAQIRAEAAGNRVSRQTLVREEINTLVAEARLDIARAAEQAALAFAIASMGIEPYADLEAHIPPVKRIAAADGGGAPLGTARLEERD